MAYRYPPLDGYQQILGQNRRRGQASRMLEEEQGPIPYVPVAVPKKPDLISRPMSDWVPDTAARARVPIYSPYSDDPEVGGQYGRTFGGNTEIDVFPAVIQRDFDNARNMVVAHEAGHSIYFNSTSPEEQKAWDQIHDQAARPYLDSWFGKGISRDVGRVRYFTNEGIRNRVSQNVIQSAADPFARYWDDPSHSFADAYGKYVSNPEWLKKTYPEAYNFFKKKLAFEYSRAVGK